MSEHIEHKVKEAVSEVLCVDYANLSLSDNLENLGMDSLDKVELALVLEEIVDSEISDEEFESCTTIQDLLDLVNSKL